MFNNILITILLYINKKTFEKMFVFNTLNLAPTQSCISYKKSISLQLLYFNILEHP